MIQSQIVAKGMLLALHTSICNPDGKVGAVIFALLTIYAGIFINNPWISRWIKVQDVLGAYVYTYPALFTVTFIYVDGK